MNPIFNLLITFPIGWFSIFVLGTALFRYKVEHYQRPILTSTLLITLLSYFIQLNNLAMVMTIVQPITFILCFKYLFRFAWNHSIIMTLILYSIVMTIEWSIHGINALLTDNNLVHTLVNDDFTLTIYIPIVHHFLACIILHYRLGFTFIHTIDKGWRNTPKTNILVLLLACVGFFIVGTTSINLFLLNSLPFSIYGKVILGATMLALMVSYYVEETRKR